MPQQSGQREAVLLFPWGGLLVSVCPCPPTLSHEGRGANACERRYDHRTLTHSAPLLLAVGLLASPLGLLNPSYVWAVVGGYGSHLWLDMVNLRGIDLFWPSPLQVVTPGNRNWRLEVGSKGEMVLQPGILPGRDSAAALCPRSGATAVARPGRGPG